MGNYCCLGGGWMRSLAVQSQEQISHVKKLL